MQKKHTLIILSILLLLAPLLTTSVLINKADAQQIVLSVSAKDTGGKFFGPQIVQVVIDGPSIRNPDTNPGSVIVNGVNLPMVHLADGRWYGFFADGSTFTTLAGVTGFPGNINGNFWIIGPSGKNVLFPTLPTAFRNDPMNDFINPNLDLNGDCPSLVNDQNTCVEWPYIRLFSFSENDQVSVRYSGQSVTLNYVRPSANEIALSLDRDSYPINAEIIFGLSDYMWNINPVEDDRVIFAFDDGGTAVFYQPSTSLPPAEITSAMQSMGFDIKQMLSLQGKNGIRFSNTINGVPATALIEIFPNSGAFENLDKSSSRADMFAKERNVQFRFDYFNKSISAGMGTSDAHISIGKEEPKTGTKPEVPEVGIPMVDPYSISEIKLVDLLGKAIKEVHTQQPVMIQTTITNNWNESQAFTYIVQVKDENEFTAMLTWIKGNLYAKKSFNAGISWTPEGKGDYEVEIFVWKSIDEPGILPLTKRMQISVS
ncbi:MAG: hypothetical protein QXU32_00315 [Nitrososphaerales archaeon]